MLAGLIRVTRNAKSPAAASASPTRWNDIRPPLPHDRGSASVPSTAAANDGPSTSMPSSTSTTKRCSGPVPWTCEVPGTTVTLPAPCWTKPGAPTAVSAAVGPRPGAAGDDDAGPPGAGLRGDPPGCAVGGDGTADPRALGAARGL